VAKKTFWGNLGGKIDILSTHGKLQLPAKPTFLTQDAAVDRMLGVNGDGACRGNAVPFRRLCPSCFLYYFGHLKNPGLID